MSAHDDRVRVALTARGWAEIGGTPTRFTPEIGRTGRAELTEAGRTVLLERGGLTARTSDDASDD